MRGVIRTDRDDDRLRFGFRRSGGVRQAEHLHRMPKMNSLNSLASILPRRMSAALKRKLSSWDRVIFSCCILLFTFVSYRRRFYRITRQRPSKIRYVSVNGFFDRRMDAKKPREPFWLRGFGNTAELPGTSDDGAEEDRTVAPLRSYCSKIPS